MNFKKFISIALIASMSFSLVACGSKNADNSTSSSSGSNNDVVIDIPTGSEAHYYKTEYLSNLPKNFNNVGTTLMANDCMYYTCSDEDNKQTMLCSYNILTGDEVTYATLDNSNDPLAEHSYINQCVADEDGNLIAYIATYKYDESLAEVDVSGTTEEDLIQYYADNYGYGMSTEAILSDLKKYYYETYTDEDGNVDYGKVKLAFMAWDYDIVYSYRVAKFDKSGNEVYSTPISAQGDMNLDAYNMIDLADGNVAILFVDWSGDSPVYKISLFDAQGKNFKDINIENGCESIIKDLKGNLCVSKYSDTGYDFYKVDIESGNVEENATLSMSGYGTPKKYDDTHYYVNYGDQLTLVAEDGSKTERLVKWIDNDISSTQVSDSIIFSDGNIGAFMSKYSPADEKMKYEFAKLIEIPEAEVVKKQPINLAAIYVDSTLEEKIIDFNRHSNDYRIYVVSFDYTQNYEDYDAAQKNYMTALAANNNIDIIVFSYGQYGTFLNLASKGLFVDLAPLMTTGVKKDDFIPSVIAPLTMNDKLYALPNTFTLETVLGAARDVGTKSGWTVDEAKALLESKPEGTKFMAYMTRERMLQNLIDLNYSEFVDTANVTCNFDNDDFKKVLEFANLFPVETDDDMVAYEMEDDTELLASGKVLLQDYYVNDFSEYQMYKRIFDDDVTYIGFPTSNGNGAMLNYDTMYTITKNCDNPEAAWSMLSTLFESSPNAERYSTFTARKDDFDSFCKKAMEPKEGNEIYGWGSFEVEIQPATQEEVDVVKDLVYNVTAVRGAVSTEVMNIILEEADAYFKGAKSVDEVATIIQSRVRVYLSETN